MGLMLPARAGQERFLAQGLKHRSCVKAARVVPSEKEALSVITHSTCGEWIFRRIGLSDTFLLLPTKRSVSC